jgi:hypothetical protein
MCSNEGDQPTGALQMGGPDELCKLTIKLDRLASNPVADVGTVVGQRP